MTYAAHRRAWPRPRTGPAGPRTAAVGLVVVAALAGCQSGAASTPAPNTAATRGASATVGALTVTGAYVPVPASPDVAAAYFTLTNAGATPAVLVTVGSDVSTDTTLHTYTADKTRMVPLAALPIPGGASVKLAVGSTHVMIMHPSRALTAGTTVRLTLRFRAGTAVTVTAPVLADTGPQDAPATMPDMTGMTMPAATSGR